MSKQTNTQPDTQPTEETIKIGETSYLLSSLNDEQKSAFSQAIYIQRKIEDRQSDIRNLQYAHQFLHNFLEAAVDNFTAVGVPTATPEIEDVPKAETA